MGKKVIWARPAIDQTEEIHAYIIEDSGSLETADRVVDTIFDSSDILSERPEIYPKDKYKKDNDGSYRAYEVLRYRVAYRVLKDTVRILRVRHTSREPLEY